MLQDNFRTILESSLQKMYSLLRNFLFSLHPEFAHDLVKSTSPVIPKFLLSKLTHFESPRLHCSVGKQALLNPIGLAAGFDKNGGLVNFLEAIGFGYLELGSVTALPCDGNPKPRIFRLPLDQSLINRMGLPNIGAQKFETQFAKLKPAIPIGINISKTPNFAQPEKKLSVEDDYITTFRNVHRFASYIVLNLSCPNSGESKLLEDPTEFLPLAKAIAKEREISKFKNPLLIKISPDLDKPSLHKLVDLACKYDFDGFVLTNTTTQRPLKRTLQKKILDIGRGGLSGQALREMSNSQLHMVFDIVGRNKLLIGVGGIMGFEDLLQKLKCGASLFQVYTGFIYNGPLFVKQLNQQLDAHCKKLGVKNYMELVGEK